MTDIALDEKALEAAAHAAFEAGWPHERERQEQMERNPDTLAGYQKIVGPAIRAYLASPSQVAPQPQASEPVAMKARDERIAFEDWALADHRDIQPNRDEERHPGNYHYYECDSTNDAYIGWCERSTVASPQRANPAQVTADREALIEKYASACKRNAAEMMTMPPSVVLQHFREFADEIAAIGAGGQAVATEAVISAMVSTYNRVTGYALPQASIKEQRDAMLAIYAVINKLEAGR